RGCIWIAVLPGHERAQAVVLDARRVLEAVTAGEAPVAPRPRQLAEQDPLTALPPLQQNDGARGRDGSWDTAAHRKDLAVAQPGTRHTQRHVRMLQHSVRRRRVRGKWWLRRRSGRRLRGCGRRRWGGLAGRISMLAVAVRRATVSPVVVAVPGVDGVHPSVR